MLARRGPVVVRARRRDHDRDDACRWRCAGSGCSPRRGCAERLPWLTRAYFVAYTAGQILPTSIGGDAVRIFETSRRHPGGSAAITAIVLLERALGGAATVLLGAVGFVLALGRYDVGAYLWLEGAFVVGTIVLAFVFFSRAARPLLRRSTPAARGASGSSGPLRARLRGRPRLPRPRRLLGGVFALTLAVQAVRDPRDLGDGARGRASTSRRASTT